MSESLEPPLHSDVCLLLRAHAEQGWLRREVLPVLDQIDADTGAGQERLEVALAYLEVVWTQARLRACETDATLAWLERADGATHLSERACSYYGAVSTLRERLDARVATLLSRSIWAQA